MGRPGVTPLQSSVAAIATHSHKHHVGLCARLVLMPCHGVVLQMCLFTVCGLQAFLNASVFLSCLYSLTWKIRNSKTDISGVNKE